MTHDVLDRLARHDPADGLDATPPDALLAQLLAEPQTPSTASRSRRAARPVLAMAAAVVLTVGVVAGRDGGVPDLAARAYAQTDPRGVVLHVVRSGRTESSGSGLVDGSGTAETWTYGDEAHVVLTERQDDGQTSTYDQLLGADGVLRNRIDGVHERVIDPQDSLEVRAAIASLRGDFVGDFRKRYERGALDDTGTTTFAGRAARRYVVDGQPPVGPGPGAAREEYFLDAETGAPLGSVMTHRLYKPQLVDGKLIRRGKLDGTLRSTQVIDRLERLPATPANLAKVRER